VCQIQECVMHGRGGWMIGYLWQGGSDVLCTIDGHMCVNRCNTIRVDMIGIAISNTTLIVLVSARSVHTMIFINAYVHRLIGNLSQKFK
jgi:hypothetical protein